MTDPLSRRSVVVTGAAGYIGRHVVSALADDGYDVVAVCRPGNTAGIDRRARVVETDVLSADLELASIVDDSTAAVIHLAWQDGFVHNAASHMLRLSDHFRFLQSVAAAGVPRIAPLGTMHEVGYWEGGITATTPTNPRSMYGIAKDALRRAVFLALPDTEIAWLRCYYIYGDDRNNRSIFTRVLEAADKGRASLPFTTGRNQYDFIRVEELAGQIALAATTAGFTGIINCSSGEPLSLAAKVEQFIADNGLQIELEYGAYPDRPYDSPAVWGVADDIQRLVAAKAHAI
jgi:nucleoside-diphosphate-sugar epimerase